MRQIAHLNASIDKNYKPPDTKSRIETYKAAGAGPDLPKVEKGQYLLDYLYEIGPSKSGAAGPVPIEWIDIKAWSDVTGVYLTREEALIVRGLSKDFVGQLNASRNPSEPSPYLPDQSSANRLVLFKDHPAYKNKTP